MSAAAGRWSALPGGHGASLAVAGDVTAAGQLGHLTVWAGRERIAQVTAHAPAPGRPRVVAARARAYWGPGVVDLATGLLAPLAELAEATTGRPVPRSAGHPPGDRVGAYAWAPDGSAVLVCVGSSVRAGAALRDGSGRLLAPLWEGAEPAPRAAWAGNTLVAVGRARPAVFTRSGDPVVELPPGTPPVRIEADAAETRLMVVEHPRLTLWDTSAWTPVATAEGPWLDAALSPDGRLVVAVDLAGGVQVLDGALADPRPVPAPEGILDGAVGVALDDDRVAVAYPGAVHTAPLLR